MTKHTILIVDDDKLILNTLKEKFNTQSIDVYGASNSREAKELLTKFSPEIVLLDMLLPKEENALEVIDYMKGEPKLENIPVIALTNLDNPELEKTVLAKGVKEYLIKGQIRIDELYNKVLSYLEPPAHT